jgi:hypothetical protein
VLARDCKLRDGTLRDKWSQREAWASVLRTDVGSDDVPFVLEGAPTESLVVVVVVVECLADEVLESMSVKNHSKALST